MKIKHVNQEQFSKYKKKATHTKNKLMKAKQTKKLIWYLTTNFTIFNLTIRISLVFINTTPRKKTLKTFESLISETL